jgi:hypothetical protein
MCAVACDICHVALWSRILKPSAIACQPSGSAITHRLQAAFCLSVRRVCLLQVLMPPISGRRVVDFGVGLGRRTCYLYNLPEVYSANEYMKVGMQSCLTTCPTRVGIWNWRNQRSMSQFRLRFVQLQML